MKKIQIFIITILLTSNLFGQVEVTSPNATFFDYVRDCKSRQNDSTPNKELDRLIKIWSPRLAAIGGNCNIARTAIHEYSANYIAPSFQTYNPNWIELGPIGKTTDASCNIGRMYNIRFDSYYNGTTNKIVYACSGYGGLYKSKDDGISWSNLETNTDIGIPQTSVFDIAIHPTNSNVLFIATGDGDNIPGYGTRAGNQNPVFSDGVYRSVDNGTTWQPINSGLTLSNIEIACIRRIIINPQNPNQIFIATNDGIYRTNNANAINPNDVAWTQVLTGLNGYFDTQFKGLEFKPGNPNVVYASGYDIYRSSDGGNNWTSMTSQYGFDLSALNQTRVNIAVSPAEPENVFAYINANQRYSIYIYKFENNLWIKKYSDIRPFDPDESGPFSPGRMGFAVSPTNANNIYFGSVSVYKSTNGSTFNSDHSTGIHADIHGLTFTPTASPSIFCACDGGVSSKINPLVSYTWQPRNNGLGISKYWAFDDSEFNKNLVLSGFQDCGTKKSINSTWSYVAGGDGYGAFIPITDTSQVFYVVNDYSNGLKRYDYKTNHTYTDVKPSLVPGEGGTYMRLNECI